MIRYGKHIKNQAVLTLLISAILFIQIPYVSAENNDYTNKELEQTIHGVYDWKCKEEKIAGKKLFDSNFVENAGSSATDWFAFGIGRCGIEDDYSSYLALLKSNVTEKYATKDLLGANKATEWHRIALTVLSLGGDPTNFGTDSNGKPINLIADGTYYRGKTDSLGAQGVNAYIWALITLDSMNYSVPDDAMDTRESIIDKIVTSQQPDGGFSLDGTNSDVDITAMALTALAPYNNKENILYEKVAEPIKRAVNWLSSCQNESGGFKAWGQNSSESSAQVMVALCALGIDPCNDQRFIKNGCDVLTGLMSYHNNDGGFAHSFENDDQNKEAIAGKSNMIASSQSLYALCSLYRMRTGLPSLFDFKESSNKVKNIFTNEILSSGLIFNSSDIEEYNKIPETLTTENYTAVIRLYEKLLVAENRDDYKDIMNALAEKRNSVISLKKEINDINSQIADRLYPFDSIKLADKEQINSLVLRCNNLSEYDKGKILGYDDLIKSQAKLRSKLRSNIIAIVMALLLTLAIIFIILRLKKKRKIKKLLENDEW